MKSFGSFKIKKIKRRKGKMVMAKEQWIDFFGGIVGWLVLAMVCIFFFLIGAIDWFDLIKEKRRNNKEYLSKLREEVKTLKTTYRDLISGRSENLANFFLTYDALLENIRRWFKGSNYFFEEGKGMGFEKFLDNKLIKIGISFCELKIMQEIISIKFGIEEKKDIKEIILRDKEDYSSIHQRAWMFLAPYLVKNNLN